VPDARDVTTTRARAATILVALDGSQSAEVVLPYAQRLATALGAQLVLARAAPAFPIAGVPPSESEAIAIADAKRYVDAVADRLRGQGLVVETVVPNDDPAPGLLAEADRRRASLIVISTHRRSGAGRWLSGSVSDEIARTAAVPVLVVPRDGGRAWPEDLPLRILAPLDRSALAEAALAQIQEFAERLGAELVLMAAVRRSGSAASARQRLEALASRLAEPLRRRAAVRVDVGRGASAIVRAASDDRIDLIAMAGHGRAGLARAILGSTTTGVLQRAPVPVLVVHPPKARAREAARHEDGR
jgi:nucleotide-binding universal stress UspA family protein